MIKFRKVHLGVMALVLSFAVSSPLLLSGAYAADAGNESVKAENLRSEILKPLSAAKALADKKDFAAALAKIAETDAVQNKTPTEIFAVERTRADYLLSAGDKAKAAKSFEMVVDTKLLNRANQLNVMLAIGQIYFQMSNYPASITWMKRYADEGGVDPRAKDILLKAYYLNKDYKISYKGFSDEVQADIAAGKVPNEQTLKLLTSSAALLDDKPEILKSVELANSYFPNAKQWLYLIQQVHSKPGFADRLYLDIYRLKQSLGLLNEASDVVDMADLATKAGLPGEAKKVFDQGFADGLMKGAEAKKYTGLLDAATKRANDDLKTMSQGEVSANKSKEGTGLVNLGMAYATSGQFDKGIALIEQGIAKGGLARPEEAKLHLGEVYFWAGKKDEAIKQLQSVEGGDAVYDLARYWVMQIKNPLPPEN